MKAIIRQVEYYLPAKILSNAELVANSSDWTAEKISCKIGVEQRHIAASEECSSDLAFMAAEKLFTKHLCTHRDIDFLLFCTQTPDFCLPTSACILQDRLNLPRSCGALDFNLGCSGYIYGISLAKGLIESGQAKNILLLTGETYTKLINPNDIGTRSIFGDAGSATLVCGVPDKEFDKQYISTPLFGTNGAGAENLIVKNSGKRHDSNALDNTSCDTFLYMNGPEIFSFTIDVVPKLVNDILRNCQKEITDINFFIFHQANAYILKYLRDRMAILEEKFYLDLTDIGNTVSSSIPIAMKRACDSGKIKCGDNIMLVGFGVGYSWGGMVVSFPSIF